MAADPFDSGSDVHQSPKKAMLLSRATTGKDSSITQMKLDDTMFVSEYRFMVRSSSRFMRRSLKVFCRRNENDKLNSKRGILF